MKLNKTKVNKTLLLKAAGNAFGVPEDWSAKLGPRWKNSDMVDMVGYDLLLKPKGPVDALDLVDVATKLDKVTGNEDDGFVVDGLRWRLGDGDDSLAAGYKPGVGFFVWLRTWGPAK